ncbi:MAG TPA: hypothetical protein VF170_16385, partial [Planctomycetaceae bacterium]
MARHEADREDLLAEATALVRRAELALPGSPEPVVAGFRRDGGLSVYFGGDPAYHFDPAGRLKRAYRGGRLYRTQGETLAELTRDRTATETALLRRDLTPEETESFLTEMSVRLALLGAAVERGEARVGRRVPDGDGAFLADLGGFLARTGRLAPRYKG